MSLPAVASREEWLVARRTLLAREKEATLARDALNTARRELPMVPARGTEVMTGAYSVLDLTALGRQEDWEEPKGRVEKPHEADPSFS